MARVVALMRSRRSAVAAALAVVAVVLTVSMLLPQRDLGTPCPAGQHAEQPLSVHLVPNVVEHGNWLLVRTSGLAPGTVLLACTNGVVVGIDPLDEADLQAGTDTLPVSTRWVDWMWLSGRLDEYTNPDRWLIIYPVDGIP